jgi:HlyD family secretion protein
MDDRSPKPRAKILRRIVILVAVLGVGGYYVSRSLATKTPVGVIVASGSIEADETIIAPKVAGKLAELLVDEGYDVKKGQLLAKLDDTELRAQFEQAQAALASAQAKYEEAINGNRPEQIAQAAAELAAAESAAKGSTRVLTTTRRNMQTVLDLRTQLDSAEARVPAAEAAYRQAQQALKLALAGSRPRQIDEARAALAQARITLDKAGIDFARIKTLADQGALAVQNCDDARAARDSAQKQVEQAQAHLDDLLAGSRPEEIQEAEQAVAQAKANLDGARTNLTDARRTFNDRLTAQGQFDTQAASKDVAVAQVAASHAAFDLMRNGSRIEDIESAKANRDQAKKSVDYAGSLVADTKLYAPTDGVVKTKDSLAGETLNVGTPVVTLADLDHIWIRVYVPEDQYGGLKLGQAVEVKVDSFPKEIFPGKIVAINSDAEFTPKDAQTPEERVKLVFGVKIAVPNPGRRLKPGMPGDATIHVR